MKLKKLMAISLAALIGFGLFTGCGNKDENANSTEMKLVKEGTLNTDSRT